MKTLAFDTETTGLRPHCGDRMFSWSTCDLDTERIEVTRLDGEDGTSPAAARRKLDALAREIEAGRVTIVCHNAKFDVAMLEKAVGRRVMEPALVHDTYLLSNVLRSDRYSHKLKDLAWTYAGIPADDERAIKPYVSKADGFQKVPPKLMREYQRRDAVRTALLYLFFLPQVQANAQWQETYEVELAVQKVSLRMEERGMMLDRRGCIALSSELASKAEAAVDEVERLVGRRVNIGNDNRARELLFQDLRLKPVAHTPTGLPKVDGESLAAIDDGGDARVRAVLEAIRRHGSWSSGATMLRSYLALADENGIVHPSINTCQARTGRQSSSGPNLQNVQKEVNLLNPYAVPARRVFRPRPGYVHFHVDYKGLQFRLAIIRTGDEKLLQLARTEDLHVIGARILYSASVWDAADKARRKVMRNAAKNANFAKMFGAGRAKIGATLGRDVPASRLREYDEVFGALNVNAERITAAARECGYVDTMLGRRLWVPTDKPYVAVNYGIQGDEADVVKRAEIRAAKVLLDETGGEAQMLLPVHDEIIIEWPRTRLRDARPVLRKLRAATTDFPMFPIPLDVEVELSTLNWAAKSAFDIDAED